MPATPPKGLIVGQQQRACTRSLSVGFLPKLSGLIWPCQGSVCSLYPSGLCLLSLSRGRLFREVHSLLLRLLLWLSPLFLPLSSANGAVAKRPVRPQLLPTVFPVPLPGGEQTPMNRLPPAANHHPLRQSLSLGSHEPCVLGKKTCGQERVIKAARPPLRPGSLIA